MLLPALPLGATLAWQRQAVLEGELWRLVTPVLVHAGSAHLALNAASALLLSALAYRQRLVRASLLAALPLCVLTHLALLATPYLWYVGASAFLYAWATWLAWRLERWIREGLLVFLVVKASLPAASLGIAVATAAHWCGLAVGTFAALVFYRSKPYFSRRLQ